MDNRGRDENSGQESAGCVRPIRGPEDSLEIRQAGWKLIEKHKDGRPLGPQAETHRAPLCSHGPQTSDPRGLHGPLPLPG